MRILHPILFISLLSTLVSAQAAPSIKCPSVDAIIAVGFQTIAQGEKGTWSAYITLQNYDTTLPWNFGIWEFKAADINDATKIANATLKKMQYAAGPYVIPNAIICDYKTDVGYAATVHVGNSKS